MDNTVINTVALETLVYVPSTGKFVVQTATGTYKCSWQTLVSTLTANIPPAGS